MTGSEFARSFGLDDAADVNSDETPESNAEQGLVSCDLGERAVEVDNEPVLIDLPYPSPSLATAGADPVEDATPRFSDAVMPEVPSRARSHPTFTDAIDAACCGRDRVAIDRLVVPAATIRDLALVAEDTGQAEVGRAKARADRSDEPLPLAATQDAPRPSAPVYDWRAASREPEPHSEWSFASDWRNRASFALRVAAYGIAAWFAYVVLAGLLYRFADPPASNLMVWTGLAGRSVEHTWVPLDRISPSLARTVIVSEDARFCRHYGVDFAEIAAAVARSRNGMPRGASTITMQVAKNLFLWPGKSYLRKVLEVPITLLLEIFWPKTRILEVYLNIAEWGRGTFGAEAAARHHFGRTAARLSEREAALLAVSLPNPIVRNAGRPGPATARLARLIQVRARAAGASTFSCLAR